MAIIFFSLMLTLPAHAQPTIDACHLEAGMYGYLAKIRDTGVKEKPTVDFLSAHLKSDEQVAIQHMADLVWSPDMAKVTPDQISASVYSVCTINRKK